MTTIPGFLTKTYEIFNTPEYIDCCGWGNNGTTIVIKKIEQFSKSVLPKYFKHSNFQSFVRQLNMTVQDPNHGEFQHLSFQQNRPDLLPNIKRKAHHKSSESTKKSEKNIGDGSEGNSIGQFVSTSGALLSHTTKRESSSEISYNHDNMLSYIQNKDPEHKISEEDLKTEMKAVLNDLLHQKASRDEFEKRIQDMEAESARVAGENLVLKSLVLDSRNKQTAMQEKMEKVLQTLYNMFMSGSNVALNNSNLALDSTEDSSEGNNIGLLPLLTRSPPSSQMLENLIYRLDYMQTYGLKMGGGNINGSGQILDLAGSDAVPISNIANDMMQLATSCKDSSYNNDDIGYIMNKNLTGSSSFMPYVDKVVTVSGGEELGQFGSNFSFDSLMGPSYSFDTLASRVSAPDLNSMAEDCLAGAGIKNEIDNTQRNKNISSSGGIYIKDEPKNTHNNDGAISGGGSLIRQGSIYPGGESDDFPQPSAGFPLDRLDSEFSWSTLFSMNSVDGYGLSAPNLSTLSHQLDSKLFSENEEHITKPSSNDTKNENHNTDNTKNDEKNKNTLEDEMINAKKNESIFDESIIKKEKFGDIKRGILEYESSNTTESESKRNVRQKSALHPPHHNLNDTNFEIKDDTMTYSDMFPATSSSSVPIISSSSSSSLNLSSSSSNTSAPALISKSDSDIFIKNRPENFYGNLQKQQGATLTRIDSLEQSISIFLKSIDSIDGNNSNISHNSSSGSGVT